jgi:peptidyl-tRNA hydrolase, PTH1 family
MLRHTPSPERLVVGLGNPGREYAHSRHNVGFLVVDALALKQGVRFSHRWSRAQVAVGCIGGHRIALAKPQTYMNLAGESVRSLLDKLGVDHASLLVVADDIDLPLGRVRLRERGSSGGHRGIQSVIDRLGTQEFARLKLGVGRPDPSDAADYVLGEFGSAEDEALRGMIARAIEAVESAISEGVSAAMNRHNR